MTGATGKPISLCGKTFGSKEEMFEHFSDVLHSLPPGGIAGSPHSEMLLELLKEGHRDASEKIGCGVKHFEAGFHPEYNAKCFMLVRKDGSRIDFSFRKCINNMLSKRWVTEMPPLLRLRLHSRRLMAALKAKTQLKRYDDDLGHATAEEVIADVWNIIAEEENLNFSTASVVRPQHAGAELLLQRWPQGHHQGAPGLPADRRGGGPEPRSGKAAAAARLLGRLVAEPPWARRPAPPQDLLHVHGGAPQPGQLQRHSRAAPQLCRVWLPRAAALHEEPQQRDHPSDRGLRA
uniref:Protein chloroplastic-like n=1 Tax=Tetraselmis sp. GSL018 TaxID=582737 RepID=A0A061S9K0_9CHLO